MNEPFELPKSYEPHLVEDKWSHFWEINKLFHANVHSSRPPYTIVMPPPNVTGVLHMGHALVSALQDILIRWKRMLGFEALWVPGTDHAGIATQTVVERHLFATTGRRRDEFERKEFLEKVWEWKEKSEGTILAQLKKMGCSCDFSRLHFTMDASCSKAVRSAFKKLFDQGLIYRGDYLVNWDPVARTALADDEVEHEEREGHLWYFRYRLANDTRFICFATTRPETMLGDVALAVSPKDERYRSLIGEKVHHPFSNRLLTIIADHRVDPAFGTGVVKITPAHDFNDYQMGLDHNLPLINIFTSDGHINEQGGGLCGLSREQAREEIIAHMKRMGLLDRVEKHVYRVGVSYRSKAVIEPYLSKQWFVKMEPFKKRLQQIVAKEEVKLIPKSWELTYFNWINNLRDWCISRQLWWGHQIPVWYNKSNPNQMICYEGEGAPDEVLTNPDEWIQDGDVLDTWFSSALWPCSTLGWPDPTPDLLKFYPTNTLITGHDILFFWVARMIFMCDFNCHTPPFSNVFLHGLIYGKSYWRKNSDGTIAYITGEQKKKFDLGEPLPYDVHSKWEKLSKSKGNVIDPLEMITEYGTDAVRMSLCSCANQSPQIDLDRRRFEEFKNFANKIWNGARFIFLNTEDLSPNEFAEGLNESIFQLEDFWILSLMNRLNAEINTNLSNFQFEMAALSSYDFFWKEFCAYYVEISKPILFKKAGKEEQRKNKQKLLIIILCNVIRLLHPIAPFITEELFQLLKQRFSTPIINENLDLYSKLTLQALKRSACAISPYPQLICDKDINGSAEEEFKQIEAIIYTIRNIRGEMKLPPHLSIDVYLVGESELFKAHLYIIKALIKVNHITFTTTLPSIKMSATGVVGNLTILIPVPEQLALQELQRLKKEQDKLLTSLERLKTTLSNPEFTKKAHPELVIKQQNALLQIEQELSIIEKKLTEL